MNPLNPWVVFKIYRTTCAPPVNLADTEYCCGYKNQTRGTKPHKYSYSYVPGSCHKSSTTDSKILIQEDKKEGVQTSTPPPTSFVFLSAVFLAPTNVTATLLLLSTVTARNNAHNYYWQPVSYTHLTLPTNREV